MSDEHDLIVIGMGVGGEEVVGQCADAGMDVLGIERKLIGGECPYWGCVPSKVAVRAANSLAEALRITQVAGRASVVPDYAPVAARIREVTANWDDQIAVDRYVGKGATFVRGTASLTGARSVSVDGREYRARRGIVIATGGEPIVPPIPGLSEVDYWTNREALEAKEPPRSMIVLGGGPIGLELAQAFHRFGTDITIVETMDRVLSAEEPENGKALTEAILTEGLKIRCGVTAASVARAADQTAVTLSDGSVISAERLLVATGRRSDLSSLGLSAAGIDDSGRYIAVDENVRAADGIWAIGDATGGGFTHVAVYEGRIAAAEAMGVAHKPVDLSAVPRVTFTDPEVASVGLSEKAARERGRDVRVGVATTASSARGWIHGPGAEHGVTKVIASAGAIVGASIMSPHAGESIGLLTLAVKEKIPVSVLRDLIYAYPTFTRGIEDALRQVDA